MKASRSPEKIALSSAGMRLGRQLFTYESEIKTYSRQQKRLCDDQAKELGYVLRSWRTN